MKRAPFVTALLCCIFLTGCLVVPLPEFGTSYGRASLGKADLSFLKEGETAREEVLLRLGAPDLSLQSGDLLAYMWGGIGGFAVLAGGGIVPAGGAGPLTVYHLLTLEFGPDGRLKHAASRGSRWPDAQRSPVVPAGETSPATLTLLVDPLPDIWTRLDAVERREPRNTIRLADFRDERETPYAGNLVARITFPRFPRVEIRISRSAADTIRAAVGETLRQAGFLLVESDADFTVTGTVRHFEYQEHLFRGGQTRLDVTLSVEGRTEGGEGTRWYACKLKPDSPYLVDRSLRRTLEELQERIASDAGLMALLTPPPLLDGEAAKP